MSGLIFDIRRYSIHDGPGIRTTVFFKGCPMRCQWCHNPESQENSVEEIVRVKKLDGNLFANKSAIGFRQEAGQVLSEIDKDAVFYQESGGGVTFSGGEPLMQPDFLAEILGLCRGKGYHTAVDTCGHAEPAVIKRIMEKTHLFLYDLKLMNDLEHIEYTGVSNELSMINLDMIARAGMEVIIRFPVIPGITDRQDNLEAVSALMNRLSLKQIDLLPYHTIGREKYRKLGRDFLMEGIVQPTDDRMKELRTYFEEKSFIVNIGGG
jgi:pyruvate formate lyase activating enzyme